LINGLSDHETQYLCVNNIFDWQAGNFRPVKKRLITKSAVSMFIELFKNESWDNIINHSDVNESFDLFLNISVIIFESCLRMQYVTNKVSNNHQITAGIKVSCKCKKYLYITSKTTNCSKIKVYYIQYCRFLRKVIRKAKEMCYNELLSSSTNKSKTSWNIINNEIGTASGKIFTETEFKLGSKIIGTNQSAKIFNNYFINSVDELITQQPNTASAMFSLTESFPYEFPQIINIPVTEAEVICAISSLKNKTSCGCDGLSNKILKLCSS